jgi:hypothetical protein
MSLLLLAIPISGLVLIVRGLQNARASIQLLVEGELASGILTYGEWTSSDDLIEHLSPARSSWFARTTASDSAESKMSERPVATMRETRFWSECRIAYPLQDGRILERIERIRRNCQRRSGPREPVLYNPENPEQVLLLNELDVDIEVSDCGEWEVTPEPWPWIKATGLGVLAGAGPLIGLLIWVLL